LADYAEENKLESSVLIFEKKVISSQPSTKRSERWTWTAQSTRYY